MPFANTAADQEANHELAGAACSREQRGGFSPNVRVMVPKKNGSDSLPIPCGSCILVMIKQSLLKPKQL